MGMLIPVSVNPLGTFVCVTVAVDPPEFVKVSCRVWLSPTCTLPKLNAAGLAVRDPGVAADPDSGTLIVGLDASLTIETFPLAGWLDWGAKVMLKVLLCPADNAIGTLRFPSV